MNGTQQNKNLFHYFIKDDQKSEISIQNFH